MKEYDIEVTVKTPLMKMNQFAYLELQQYCKENAFDYIASPVIFSKSDGDHSPLDLWITEENLKQIVKDTDSLYGADFFLEGDEPCPAVRYNLAIDCFGKVYPCNSMYIEVGDILQDSLTNIWNNSRELNQIRNIKKSNLEMCQKCSLSSKCSRCPGLALLEDGDLLAC